ncbi:MAG: hypothetical protein FWD78_17305 [Treponema sp.]|nr:hypothetical protein [Treponema sp.]
MKQWKLLIALIIISFISCAENPSTPEAPPEASPGAQQPAAVPEQPAILQIAEPQIAEPQTAAPAQEPAVQPAAEPAPEPATIVQPEPQAPAQTEPAVQIPAETPAEPAPVNEPVNDPGTLIPENIYIATQEEFDTTKADIQKLIQDLNRIIRASNYNSWLTYLSDEYKGRINSKEFLDDIKARYPVFRTKINNARDYFNNVVVPSRANDRVDDIEFISKNEVIAYTMDNHNQRLVLYHLENTDGKWKIMN